MSETKDVEVVEGTLVKTDGLTNLVKEQDRPLLGIMSDTLDWKSLKPNQMAVLLMQKPFPVTGGGVMYLNLRQAQYFAVRCFELGVSPFSSAVWFDPQRFSVNLTLEGKREVARNKGIDIGPPSFEEVSREWKDIARPTAIADELKKLGFAKDIGIKCTIRVGDPSYKETANYCAWMSEWYVPKSVVWQAKPIHMLTIRANEKTVTIALGTGISEMPSDKEIE